MNLPPRFLNYLRVLNPATGKYDKIPCDPSGRAVNAHDVSNHMTFEQARAHATFSDDPTKPYGVAFDLRAEDGWFFLDLDKCRDAAGNWSAEAQAIFLSFTGAWGEVSQSGNGLHIMGRCDPARLKDRRNKFDGWKEFYTDARFIAFGRGGWLPINNSTGVDRDWTEQLLRVVPQREHLGELPEGVDPAYTGPSDDSALIALMLRSSGGAGAAFGMRATVADLWNAKADVLAKFYPSYSGVAGEFDRSSADAALMSHLAFWTGKDMPRMDRLFRLSGLMREKYANREDYRRDTIQGAARLCKTVYDRPRTMPGMKSAPTATATADDAVAQMYLTVPEMHEYFKDCIYIQDMHRVMLPDGRMMRSEQFNAAFGGHEFQMRPDGSKPTDEAFKALTQNKATRFPQAQRPCFRPDLPPRLILPDGSVNTYIPPAVAMTEGDVTPFLSLMGKLLPDAGDRAILLAYMAAVVQYPGVKFQWAPVLQGCEGNGKTALMSTVAYAVGENYTHSPKADQLSEKYNGYIECKVFIMVEEIHMAGRREMLDVLKPLITNLRMEVRGMAQEKRMVHNLANWAFCTNYQDAVIKSRNDRRYAIFFTAQQSAADLVRDGMSGEYFPNFWDWLRAGGYAAVAHYLTHYAIPADLNPAGSCHRAPITSSTEAAVEISQGGLESDIVEAAENNTPGFRGGWASSWAVQKLAKDRGVRIGRNKFKDILESLGYRPAGRAIYPISREDDLRPVLYAKPGVNTGVREYERAQNYPLV
jgi:hypothetical protein